MEAKVYQEITQFQAKVLLGMSWRQVACAVAALTLGGAAYAAFWTAGMQDLGQYVACLIALPFGAIGWLRPKGLKFEEYARWVWHHQWDKQRRVYGQQPRYEVEVRGGEYGVRTKPSSRRKRVVEHGQ